MPFVRYFLFTGGILLGFLFWADWYFPKPVIEASASAFDRSTIRIHASQKWPAAVRIDTAMPIPRAAPAAAAPAAAQPSASEGSPQRLRQAYAFVETPKASALAKLHRRARPIIRLSAHDAQQRLTSSQPIWSPTAW